ncbi:MAG: phosphatase PAP2 family protein [Gemmatimonadota bacterium]
MNKTGLSTAIDSRPRRPRLASLDRLTLGYVTIASAVLIAHFAGWRHARPTAWETGWLLTAHGLVMALAVLAAIARTRCTTRHSFLAEWYPAIVMAALYSMVGLLNNGEGGAYVVFDSIVQRWELAVFGRQVSYEWIRAMPWPWLSTALHLSYLSYYPLVIGAPAALWAMGRFAHARQTIFALSLTFFACYVVFLLFPVAGPPYDWPYPDNPATQVWAAELVHRVIDWGDAWGSAFPSSHVAAAVVATWFAFKGSRTLGWILLVPTVGIILAVVYCQIHYGVDALAGLFVGLTLSIATPYLRTFETDEEIRATGERRERRRSAARPQESVAS